MSLSTSTPVLIKRAGIGYSESSCRMTYYGSDYTRAPNGQYVGDVPPVAPFGIGACGQDPVNPNYFVSMNAGAFNGACGYCAKITYGGTCVVAPIVDKCPGCAEGLDVSLHVFGQLVGGVDRAKQMGVANVNFEIVACPADRASKGSPVISDSDPCSGSSSGSSDRLRVSSESSSTTHTTRSSSSTQSTSSSTQSVMTVIVSDSSSTEFTSSSSTKSSSSTSTQSDDSSARVTQATSTKDVDEETKPAPTATADEADPMTGTSTEEIYTISSSPDLINVNGITGNIFKGPEGLPQGFGKSSGTSEYLAWHSIIAYIFFMI